MSESSINRNKRVLRVLEGIFLILLSTAMVLNMGYVMRSINSVFLFIGGHTIYLLIAIFLFEGFALIIKGKLFIPNKSWKIVPLIFFFLAIFMMVSNIEYSTFNMESDDIIRTYIDLFRNFDGGYYQRYFINLFSVPFGGGLFGYLLAVPITILIGKVASFILCGAIILLMAFILLFDSIKNFRKSIRERGEHEGEEGTETPKKKLSRAERRKEKYKHTFMEETDPFAHAREIGDDEVAPLSDLNDITPVTFSMIEDDESSPIKTIRPTNDTGTLEKAKINLFNEYDRVPPVADKPITPIIEEPIKVEPIISKEPEIILPKEEKKEVIPPVTPRPAPTPKVEEKKEVIKPVKEVKVEKKEEEIIPPPVKIEKASSVEWIPPSTEALETYQTDQQVQQNIEEAKVKMEICNQAFRDFRVEAEVVDFVIGPSITRLLIDYPSTGSIKNVDKYKTDISRRLKGVPIRFEETVPNTPYSGFEVPNPVKATVSFKEIFEALPDPKKHPTAIGFGKNITGDVVFADICEFPHMLVSGTSGSGKSVFVNSIITTLIARTSPQDLKLVLVDPKRVEMNRYRDEPHLLCPVINEANEAKVMLYKMVELMNKRYADFEHADYASNIKDYNYWANANNEPTIPYIIIILDEYADLVYSCKEVSVPLVSICAKARACGIHVIVSTQRPSTDIITGTIKANLNTRVSLMAASSTDSVTILDEGGAEDLLGNGDMLVKSPLVTRTGLARLQGCYIQTRETMYIVNYLKKNYQPEYMEEFLDLSDVEDVPVNNAYNAQNAGPIGDSDEEKYQWIKEWALTEDYVSMSKIQRSCGVGFNRAGRIVRRLQDEGVLSTESEGSNKGFKVLGGGSRFNEAPDIGSSELTDTDTNK